MVSPSSPAASHPVQITNTTSQKDQDSIQVEVLAEDSNETVPQGFEQVVNQVNASSSYASLVGPDEGTDLKFVPTEVFHEMKIAKIERDDVDAEIEYWSNAVIYSILGARPSFEVIRGFIKGIWAAFEIDKIIQVRKGVFLVRFVYIQD